MTQIKNYLTLTCSSFANLITFYALGLDFCKGVIHQFFCPVVILVFKNNFTMPESVTKRYTHEMANLITTNLSQ